MTDINRRAGVAITEEMIKRAEKCLLESGELLPYNRLSAKALALEVLEQALFGNSDTNGAKQDNH